MSKIRVRPTTISATTKSSRKKDQATNAPAALAKKAQKPRSLAQILSLGQAKVSVVDRDLAESQLAIHSIMHSARLSTTEPRNKRGELDAKKTKKGLSLAKSRP